MAGSFTGKQTYSALYPSGNTASARGRFAVITVGGYSIPSVDTGREVVLLDPRGVVRDEEDLIVYEPRDFMERMDPELRQWLDEHPEWPGLS